MIINPYRFGAAPPAGFWSAIGATSPEVWLKLNEATGSVAANSGTGFAGTYSGTIAYSQGALSSQTGADSIKTVASPNGYVQVIASNNLNFSGVVGLCYAGTGATSGGSAAILWRLQESNTQGAYLRIDQTNIIINPTVVSSPITTSVASSVLKDGNPHLILVGRLVGDTTNLRMWIDGVLVWTYALGATTFQVTNNPVVARNGSTAQYALGRYADFFIASGVDASGVAAINSAWSP